MACYYHILMESVSCRAFSTHIWTFISCHTAALASKEAETKTDWNLFPIYLQRLLCPNVEVGSEF